MSETPGVVDVKRKVGSGKFTSGQESYEGEWLDDEMHGLGTLNFSTGAVYEGEFRGNKYHGEGKYTWNDGGAYEGGWRESKMHGFGEYKDKDGVVYKVSLRGDGWMLFSFCLFCPLKPPT